jgi:hypothetical protein
MPSPAKWGMVRKRLNVSLEGDDAVVDEVVNEVVVEIPRCESFVSDNKRGPFKWFSNSSVPCQLGVTSAITRAHHPSSKS